MLIRMDSPVFKNKNGKRPPIEFRNGLNVILGTTTGSNSIGKSSALLAIDFVFGGDTYLSSDGVKQLGNHTIYFTFRFDSDYHFARSTSNPDEVIVCNNSYEETNEKLTKKEFLSFLKNQYLPIDTDLTFRQLISTYLRVYGKSNKDENYPLQGYRNQSTKESIKILVSLFDFYKDIQPFNERLDTENEKLKTFNNARKYSFISNLVGGKSKYEENIQLITELEAELESLKSSLDIKSSSVEIETSHQMESLRSGKLSIETKINQLKRKSNLIETSLEYGLVPTEADLESLTEYFPGVNVKKIYEVEKYHKKLSRILKEEFLLEKQTVDDEIENFESILNEITLKMSKLNITNTLSKDFLDKHSELNNKISALKEQNKAYADLQILQDSKKDASERLKKSVREILVEISSLLNQQMKEFNSQLYEIRRNSPIITLKDYNSYDFFTPKDTGTGTNYKGLILLDLAILYLSALPALIHDSLFFKNIDDEGTSGIIKIYTGVKSLNKQVFIAFDKQASYTDETLKILENNRVLELGGDGDELYGESWNKEVKNEIKL